MMVFGAINKVKIKLNVMMHFNIIKDPKNADRNYSKKDKNNDKYNYEIFCGYFSIPYNGGPFYRE